MPCLVVQVLRLPCTLPCHRRQKGFSFRKPLRLFEAHSLSCHPTCILHAVGDKKPQAEMGQAADGKGDGNRAVEMEPEAVARLGSFVLALPDEAAPGQFRAVPDGKEGERLDPHRFRQALDSTGPTQFRFQPVPVCPLPGLSVRYPGRTANDPSFAYGHDARSGRENARSACQRNDMPVQTTLPRLPWRMTRRPEPAVVTGRDTRGRPWRKAWICSVLSSLSLDGRGSRWKEVLER